MTIQKLIDELTKFKNKDRRVLCMALNPNKKDIKVYTGEVFYFSYKDNLIIPLVIHFKDENSPFLQKPEK